MHKDDLLKEAVEITKERARSESGGNGDFFAEFLEKIYKKLEELNGESED